MHEEIEAEPTEMDSRTENLAVTEEANVQFLNPFQSVQLPFTH